MGGLLNLERVPPLAPKYSNQLGKSCAGFQLQYTLTGNTTKVFSTVGDKGEECEPELISVPEWERRRALKNAPSNEERINGLRRKYELRLNRQFPAQGPASGSEADVQAWLATLPFAQRRLF